MGRKVVRKVATGSLRADACTSVVFEVPAAQGTSFKNPLMSRVPRLGPEGVLSVNPILLESWLDSRRNAFAPVQVIQYPGQTE